MAYLHDRVYDNGLGILQGEVNRLDICTELPATYAEATSTYSCGNATGDALPTVSAPGARSGGGREVTVGAVDHADATVTSTTTATHVALVDTGNSRLLAARALAEGQSVTQDNPFTLTSFTVGIPGVAT